MIRNNSTGRFFGSTITGNSGVGVEITSLSSLLLEGPDNMITDVNCSKSSELGGDKRGVVSDNCKKN